MMKAGAIWVSPLEVEATLMSHPAVYECTVIGASDKDELVKPNAHIGLKPDQAPSDFLTTTQAFVKDRLTLYKYPRWIEFVKDLPETATGKIQRFKLWQLDAKPTTRICSNSNEE